MTYAFSERYVLPFHMMKWCTGKIHSEQDAG